jgi:ankyrin repeat protein
MLISNTRFANRFTFYRYVLDNEPLLHWFLDHGANPNTSCTVRRTPFEEAARSSPLSTVRLLYEHGALPGNTAPVAAKSEVPGRLEVLRFLLDIGAPIDAMDHDHIPGGVGNQIIVGTPLMHACLGDTEEKDAMVEMLLQRGARTDIVDEHGETAMDKAKRWGDQRKIELLQFYIEQRRLDGIPVKTEE